MASVAPSLLVRTVEEALRVGGEVVRRGFAQKRRVRYKSVISPVTQVDEASERRIIRLIKRRFPEHTFFAEESAFLKKQSALPPAPGRHRWVIDPLDGTTNFVHGIPQACVSVAVEKDGVVLAGGVCDPFRNETFLAVRGHGAHLNGRRIRVSQVSKMIQSLLITGFPYDRQAHGAAYARELTPFLKTSMGVRRFGAAALDLAWIACGRAEGFWERKLQPWDVAAGWLLVEEAGGRVTNFSGRPYRLDETQETLATNGRIHRKMSRLLS